MSHIADQLSIILIAACWSKVTMALMRPARDRYPVALTEACSRRGQNTTLQLRCEEDIPSADVAEPMDSNLPRTQDVRTRPLGRDKGFVSPAGRRKRRGIPPPKYAARFVRRAISRGLPLAYPYGNKPAWPVKYYSRSGRPIRPTWRVIDNELTQALLHSQCAAANRIN